MPQPAIQVENLSKQYRLGGRERRFRTFGEALSEAALAPLRRLRDGRKRGEPETIWALRDVSFEVQPSQVVGIIGRNGAGKSTLLKILSRITDPTSGRVVTRGRLASLLEVGTGFHPELTGRENVYLNGAILGMTRREIDRKFDEIVEFAGVERFLDTPVKRYSSGMQLRLAFSVAAHLEPEILVIDEVLAVGDAAFQARCLGKMERVSRGGRTVLVVSHNMGLIRSFCDRCILLSEGRVVLDDEPNLVVNHYMLLGASELEGEVSWREDDPDAPRCDELALRRIRLIGPGGHAQGTFDVEAPICIEVTYEVRERLRGMRAVLELLTAEGVTAFTSTDHTQRPAETPPGRYVTICTVPGGLLNRGRYVVRLRFGIPGQRILLPAREYVTFTATGRGNHGSLFPEHWPGVVAPRLEWRTEALPAGTECPAC